MHFAKPNMFSDISKNEIEFRCMDGLLRPEGHRIVGVVQNNAFLKITCTQKLFLHNLLDLNLLKIDPQTKLRNVFYTTPIQLDLAK